MSVLTVTSEDARLRWPETIDATYEEFELHANLLRQRSAEIERGEYVTFEELEQELARRGPLDEHRAEWHSALIT